MSKYRNRPCEYQGIKFPSHRERDRWIYLSSLLIDGKIASLRRQTRFLLVPKCGENRPVHYVSDFDYLENDIYVVEDSKGKRTKDYIIKKKLMAWLHKIEIREV
jgi:hypothetical protein